MSTCLWVHQAWVRTGKSIPPNAEGVIILPPTKETDFEVPTDSGERRRAGWKEIKKFRLVREMSYIKISPGKTVLSSRGHRPSAAKALSQLRSAVRS